MLCHIKAAKKMVEREEKTVLGSPYKPVEVLKINVFFKYRHQCRFHIFIEFEWDSKPTYIRFYVGIKLVVNS